MSLTAFNRLRRVQAEAEKINNINDKVKEIQEEIESLEINNNSEEAENSSRRNTRRNSK